MKILKISLIGLIAGIICGLFSSGGGLIIVPAFIYLLKIEDKQARGTSNFIILPLVIISGIFYYKYNYINWDIGIKAAIGGIIGGVIGTVLLKKIPTIYVKIIFTIFLFFISIRMLIIN